MRNTFIKISLYSIALIGSVMMDSCKSTGPMTSESPTRIEVGSFGGFAGSYTSITFVPDGQVWKQARHKGEMETMTSVPKDVVMQAIQNINQLRKSKYQINQPGNMTYFIRLHKNGQETYELLWGGESPDERVSIIYKSLTSLARPYRPLR